MELSRRSGGSHLGAVRVEAARIAGFVRWSVRERGLGTTLSGAVRFARAQALHGRTAARRRTLTFSLGRTALPYELGRYNTAWLNERTVEVPVARRALEGVDPAQVLEVGNVLAHYGYAGHTVIDKYEQVAGVLNEDVRTYAPGRRFDAVVAVSTLEHVGFDEPEQDPAGPVTALENLRGLVSADGLLLVTVPLGYNPHVDAALRDGSFGARRRYGLRRTSDDNDWVEAPLEELWGTPYGRPWPNAQAVVVLVDGPGADRLPF